ncbi:hypothetical protein ACIQZB_34210 [Streptomyces sp. NPDC097727]
MGRVGMTEAEQHPAVVVLQVEADSDGVGHGLTGGLRLRRPRLRLRCSPG